jgi:hypothetical protein
MKQRILAILGTVTLGITLLLGSIQASWALQAGVDFTVLDTPKALVAQVSGGAQALQKSRWYTPTGIPARGCSLRPKRYPPRPNIETTFVPGSLTLARFRRPTATALTVASPKGIQPEGTPRPTYQPREDVALAHPTNFGERYRQDIQGQPVSNLPLIVLHETVIAGWQTVKVFQTPHPNEDDQASYHALIKRDGTIFYLVPPDKRAFGAGNSVFEGEAVKTNRLYSPSVNNFAYHISFETPPDGRHNGRTHSGYTDLQYRSLAWLVAKTGVPTQRITTHRLVDRSGSRQDPRSFNRDYFLRLLSRFPRSQEIVIGCPSETRETNLAPTDMDEQPSF